MKNILVATDGSEGADRALDYAAKWAKNEQADLLIVHVIGSDGLTGRTAGRFTRAQEEWLEKVLSAESAETLKKARDRVRGVGVGTIRMESRTGDVAVAIMEIAKENEVDAVVVGKRGAGRIAGLLLGSVSQKLVSLATVPVTVVP